MTTAPETRLNPPGTIVGVVTDAASSQPIAGASVLVVPFLAHPKYGDNGALTDEQGRYTVNGLGPYHCYAQVVAFNAVTGDLVGLADAGQEYTLRLLPGQRVKLPSHPGQHGAVPAARLAGTHSG
ncbi:carboxypeptidase-like regulatory domain-containing protein [Micromonospora sp. NPDC000663]|uniref:carboxypeptidase-like regulatory domain-containing protein n=1 Tax=Micromonospora sp. NPDC000663 TaxID=3364218 RepID=UPI00369929C3